MAAEGNNVRHVAGIAGDLEDRPVEALPAASHNLVVAVRLVGLVQDGDLGRRGIAAGNVGGQLHSAKRIVADVEQGEDVASGVECAVAARRLDPRVCVAEEGAAIQLKVFILVELGVIAVGERAD